MSKVNIISYLQEIEIQASYVNRNIIMYVQSNNVYSQIPNSLLANLHLCDTNQLFSSPLILVEYLITNVLRIHERVTNIIIK